MRSGCCFGKNWCLFPGILGLFGHSLRCSLKADDDEIDDLLVMVKGKGKAFGGIYKSHVIK